MCEVVVEERGVVGVVFKCLKVCCCCEMCYLGIGCWRDKGLHLVGEGKVYRIPLGNEGV